MKSLSRMLVLIIALLSICACQKNEKESIFKPTDAPSPSPTLDVKIEDVDNGTDEAQKILKSMSLEEKVYQMFFATPEDITGYDVCTAAGDATENALKKYPVGGIIYMSQNIVDKDQLTSMITNTQGYSQIPLFISVDEEGGRVSRLGDKGLIEKQPAQLDIAATGDASEAGEVGRCLGTELKALGFNMDFAPVADVIADTENSIIGDRSFGEDVGLVSKMVAAEVKAMQKEGVSATLKHFPGNGSVSADTHVGLSICERTLDELRENEFKAFSAGIDAGADFVMISHICVASLTGVDNMPATMSDKVIKNYLRDELGFSGIVITDALNMGAISNNYTAGVAAVNAVKAGADMLLMSPDIHAAHTAIVSAVNKGEIEESSIDESVYRILSLKIEKGLIK